MKTLALLVLLLLALLAPTGHGARSRAGRCRGRQPRATVRVIRSVQATRVPKTVRRVPR